MNLRDLRAALALGVMAVTAAAAPAWASNPPPGDRVALGISYDPPPTGDFIGSDLTGDLQFFVQNSDGYAREGGPIDIRSIRAGDGSVFIFEPPDPCVRLAVCGLFFSFQGAASSFPAAALGEGSPPPGDTPPLSPIIISLLIPAVIPGNPIHESGPIYAWDAPVRVGTWSATIAAPEPGAWALMLIGFAGLGAMMRPRRRVAAAGA